MTLARNSFKCSARAPVARVWPRQSPRVATKRPTCKGSQADELAAAAEAAKVHTRDLQNTQIQSGAAAATVLSGLFGLLLPLLRREMAVCFDSARERKGARRAQRNCSRRIVFNWPTRRQAKSVGQMKNGKQNIGISLRRRERSFFLFSAAARLFWPLFFACETNSRKLCATANPIGSGR